ncbi:MAG: DUF4160 domain-containing protein [Rhodospirillales bacterium]|nr:DUF4160 domain-containing protein [Rhodospirillales bacterium]
MPTIAEFDGIKICMYGEDHAPPHFHALFAEFEAQFRISDLVLLVGNLPKAQFRKVLAWAGDNQGVLALHWVRLNEE